MKFAHYLLALLYIQLSLACHGTEVGNGRPVAPDKADSKSPEASNPVNSPGNGGTASEPTSPSTGAETPVALGSGYKEHLFVPCASPLSEMVTGTFVATEESLTFTVTGSNWTSKIVGATAVYRQGTVVIPAHQYEITSDTTLMVTCDSVVTETKKRTVTFSDGFKLIWTLDASNKVNQMVLHNPQDEIVRTFQKQ